MAVKSDGSFLTQRIHPQMALVKTRIADGQLIMDCFGMDPHTVAPTVADMDRLNVEVWGDKVDALDVGDATAEWLSQAIGEPCRLVAFSVSAFRQCNPALSKPGDHTKFADAFPLLVVSEASLQDLNSRLLEPVTMDRFRPNIVVSGCEAYAEDRWTSISINGIPLRVVDACARCSVPTINPVNGTISGPEPIHTLSTYRQRHGEIYFGVNVTPDGEGNISLGDEVTVLR